MVVAIPFSLYLQTGKKNIEPSEPTVKITSFVADDQRAYLGGVTFDCRLNISNYTEFDVGNYFVGTYENGTIKEPLRYGEVGEFEGTLLSHPPYPDVRPNNVVAIVLLNNTVLDEQTN
jgi:hypothetical protein